MHFKKDSVFECCFDDLTERFLKVFYAKILPFSVKLSSVFEGKDVSTGYMFKVKYKKRTGFYLYGLATLPEYRKQGRMTGILRKAEETALDNNADFLFLATNSCKAESLYRQNGYIKIKNSESVSDVSAERHEFKQISLENYISETEQYVSVENKLRADMLRSIADSIISYKSDFGYLLIDSDDLILDFYPKTAEFRSALKVSFPDSRLFIDTYSIMMKNLTNISDTGLFDFILY